jgi:hypothetical protein
MAASVPPPSLHGSQRGDGLGYTASMVAAFVLSAAALWLMNLGSTALVLMIAGFALLLSQQRRARDAVDQRLGLAAELELARTLLERGAHGGALAIAGRVAEHARSPSMQRAALEVMAWAHLGLGRPQSARDALSWVRSFEALDPLCCAAVEDACGESLWALHLLENAARRRRLSREAILFLIDLNARLRGVEAACRLTLRELERLTIDDAHRVLSFAGDLRSTAVAALSEALHGLEARTAP